MRSWPPGARQRIRQGAAPPRAGAARPAGERAGPCAPCGQEQAYQKTLRDKDEALAQSAREAERLRERLESSETEKKLAVAEAVQRQAQALSEGEKRILTLENELAARETESRLKEKSLQEQYEEKLKSKDEQIEYYKDFKARQSTKMIGESLEQHCLTQFNTLRMTAFPTAYFEKDNDARTGSKGDFIFRESDESGTEFISIMFEMKMRPTRPRRSTKMKIFSRSWTRTAAKSTASTRCWCRCWRSTTSCTTTGIVDVSYRYEKMYVVRPQFFIPIITLRATRRALAAIPPRAGDREKPAARYPAL